MWVLLTVLADLPDEDRSQGWVTFHATNTLSVQDVFQDASLKGIEAVLNTHKAAILRGACGTEDEKRELDDCDREFPRFEPPPIPEKGNMFFGLTSPSILDYDRAWDANRNEFVYLDKNGRVVG